MKQANWVKKFFSVAIASLVLGTVSTQMSLGQEPTQPQPQEQPQQPQPPEKPKPQRSVFLLRNPCVSAGVGRVTDEDQNISIGRRFYSSVMSMMAWSSETPAAVTCRINAATPASIQLEFGIRDLDVNRPSSRVTLYLDGQPVTNETVSPGEVATLTADISNGKNLAIETTCLGSQNCAKVYFLRAQLIGDVAIAREN